MYCGAAKDAAAAAPVTVPLRPDGGRAASVGPAAGFLARHRSTIDLTLLVLAAPIAVLALATSFAVQLAARVLRRR
jgi:hypothetical protein